MDGQVIINPKTVREVGEDIATCWDKLLLTHHGHSGQDLDALVRKTMAEHQILPTQVFERLTAAPIGS